MGADGELPIETSCRELAELRAAGAPVVLVDCREPEEAAICSIEGAVLLPLGELAERAEELAGQESRRVVVYCHHGMRSLWAVQWLRSQGFEQAQSMAGGIDAWAAEIEPGMCRY
jgi:rhodanese-related sulfurtransferase